MRELGQLEATVMQRIWEWDRQVAVRDVLENLQSDRIIAYTTVMTVMDNLFQKGFLDRERQGRAYHYRATRSRAEHTAHYMEHVMSSGGDLDATLLHFVEQMPVEEVAKLRAALNRIDPDGRSSPK